ncbi:sulfite exporter TauE/SafE family protein [Emticicia fontis]
MDIAGYSASIFIGISLGLIGGGGSILTVPILVYLFRVDAALATTYSLFIVGTTSAIGSFSYFNQRLVNSKTAIVFGIPSILTIFFTRVFILPLIPQKLFSIGSVTITKNIVLMLFFAVLMIFTSYSMIKKDNHPHKDSFHKPQLKYSQLLLQGFFTGIVTGLIGAGGGFLIIPALTNLLKLPMKMAVGTSLVIISANSLFGFLFSIPNTTIQWGFLLSVVLTAVLGVITGNFLSAKIDSKNLRPAFGWFVSATGVYIILKEVFK